LVADQRVFHRQLDSDKLRLNHHWKSWPVQLDTYDDVDEYYLSIWWHWNMMEGLSDSSESSIAEELEYSEGELEEDSEELEDSGEEQSTLMGSH